MRIHQHSTFTTQPLAENLKSTLAGTNVSSQGSPIPASGEPLDALDQLEQWRTLEERIAKKACRWAAETMPLNVYIQPHPANPSLAEELFMVLRQWEVASLGLIRFRQVSSPAKSHIQILWSQMTVVGRDYEVGHTDREVCGERITKAIVTLIEEPVIDRHLDRERQTARLHTTVLHEIGHALGLEHSDQKTDIMHHRGWQNKTLSLNDTRRVQELYEPSQLKF